MGFWKRLLGSRMSFGERRPAAGFHDDRQGPPGASDALPLTDAHEATFLEAIQLREARDFQASIRLLEKVVRVRIREHGKENPLTQMAMSQLGRTLRVAGQGKAAAKLHEEVLAIRRRVYGDDHEFTVNSIAILADTLEIVGRLDDAAALRSEVEKIRDRAMAAERVKQYEASAHKGYNLRHAGDLVGSKGALETAVEGLARELGRDDDRTLRAMIQLGRTLSEMGETKTAVNVYEDVLTISLTSEPSAMAMSELADILETLGQRNRAGVLRAEAHKVFLKFNPPRSQGMLAEPRR
jgi:tetratricopeptide (TPR) repeat protein